MLEDLAARFLIGGVVVSFFAALGSALNPKSFAGLFGAAPSVALATLSLTLASEGRSYAAVEAHSMIGGAIAFFVYASCTSWSIMRYKPPTLLVTSTLTLLWLSVALGLWLAILR